MILAKLYLIVISKSNQYNLINLLREKGKTVFWNKKVNKDTSEPSNRAETC